MRGTGSAPAIQLRIVRSFTPIARAAPRCVICRRLSALANWRPVMSGFPVRDGSMIGRDALGRKALARRGGPALAPGDPPQHVVAIPPDGALAQPELPGDRAAHPGGGDALNERGHLLGGEQRPAISGRRGQRKDGASGPHGAAPLASPRRLVRRHVRVPEGRPVALQCITEAVRRGMRLMLPPPRDPAPLAPRRPRAGRGAPARRPTPAPASRAPPGEARARQPGGPRAPRRRPRQLVAPPPPSHPLGALEWPVHQGFRAIGDPLGRPPHSGSQNPSPCRRS